MPPNTLDEIVHAQKHGIARGLASLCSAHPWVLRAAMSPAGIGTTTRGARSLLIEATCNQVNQFGGYTGMTPAVFVEYVNNLAVENGFPLGQLILGGDHLGPGPWQNEPAESAMQKAADLLRACVKAGYTKLHLDASMRLGDDDPSRPLDVELIANRTAWLAQIAESTLTDLGPDCEIRYVIGSEVPVPGGATSKADDLHVTNPEDAQHTFELTHAAFGAAGLEKAWGRIIALVVQPGVEFGDDFVLDYNPDAAHYLVRFAETIPLVYEAHSTDYQTGDHLHELVRDHFAFLKVGPALTFAFREAVFALAHMENELLPRAQCSRLVERLDMLMQREPSHWRLHYHGTPGEMAFARKYSLSDRIRYYWGDEQIQSALERLLQNLREKPLPWSLLSQFMPEQSGKVRCGQIENSPVALILDKIRSVLDLYASACQ